MTPEEKLLSEAKMMRQCIIEAMAEKRAELRIIEHFRTKLEDIVDAEKKARAAT